MKYAVGKEKGGRYFICREGREDIPLSSQRYAEKKKALKVCASLNGLDFKQYMKMYRKDHKDDQD